MNGQGCAGHGSLADELRKYAGGALDVLEPLMERIRTRPPDVTGPEPVSCTACPVCALITVLRGGRSELAVQLAEQVAGLLTVLRTALEEGIGADHPPTDRNRATSERPAAGAQPTPVPTSGTTSTRTGPTRTGRGQRPHMGPRVQRIPVDRDGWWRASAPHPESC
jgi:hypothetical protein